ncbi:MAG: peptidyl-prolyl cis-trans isomerase [Tannerella sp.]|jgi:peptidyl-prolyl cis-trans isomerase SurA|nr:peptidyl-prolyl cis-trans isomerase [Tannerella sp.]
MMKNVFVLILLGLNCCLVYSQKKENPVVMTIAGKEIPLSEFLFLAQKDEGVNLSDKKSLENYVEMFKNFKLKVADAESRRFQESISFQEELNKYKAQLTASYLSDKEGEAKVMRKIYDRGNELISVSHIVFKLPQKTVSNDTIEIYNKANEVYKRILAGEDFKSIGEAFNAEENKEAIYEEIGYMFPLQAVKALENAVYSLPAGSISSPVRTTFGYHIIKIDGRVPNPGRIKVAHILINSDNPDEEQDDEALLKKANEVYEKAIGGEDFDELAKTYSVDKNTADEGGVLPYFGLGEMVSPFEKAAFALSNVGEISKPVKSRYGYHIIKLLDHKERLPYIEVERNIYLTMKEGEWSFELFESFDETQKKKFGYTFNQDAYNDLQKLCDDYFPTDTAFYNRASKMTKTLMHMNGIDFPQNEFAEFLRMYPLSTKTYSGDFLSEVYQLFVREILTELEKRTLNEDHPEFSKLMQEYRDGILLFEISSTKIWDKPVEEQAELEKQWIKELNNKFETKIDWKVLKNIKNYL